MYCRCLVTMTTVCFDAPTANTEWWREHPETRHLAVHFPSEQFFKKKRDNKKEVAAGHSLCSSGADLKVSSSRSKVRWVTTEWASCPAKLLWRISFCAARCGSRGGRAPWRGWGWGWGAAGGPLGPSPPPGPDWGIAEEDLPAWKLPLVLLWVGSRDW